MVICLAVTIYNLGKFHHDLTVLPHWNHGLFEGNHPQMALIRVSEYNLHRYNHGVFSQAIIPG